MQQIHLLTLAGPDRPGIMDKIASTIAGHSGNWLESRLVHLGTHFAGVVRYAVPEAQANAVRSALEDLSGGGLTVGVHEDPSTLAAPAPSAPVVRIQLVGLDRPGIVSRVTQTLARHHINVEEFSSATESAPMTGEQLFRAAASLSCPPDLPLDALRQELDGIAAELDLEIDHDSLS